MPVPIIGEPVETFEWSGDSRPTTKLLTILDNITDEDLLDVKPLYDGINTDAIDGLFSSECQQRGKASIWLRFEYLDYIILLRDDGRGKIFAKTEIK